jgi:hypothetical protein
MEFRVAGVTFENRQNIIHTLLDVPHNARGIYLEAEPNNQYDANAIAVHCVHGKIGYIPRDIARNNVCVNKLVLSSKIIGNEILGVVLRVQ